MDSDYLFNGDLRHLLLPHVLREFASKLGWDIVATHSDDFPVAARRASDQDSGQMMESASRREFDGWLFFAFARLSREGVLSTLNYSASLDSYGVAWRSYAEQWIDSTGIFRDAVISIMATIAKQERVRRSERTKAGLAREQSKTVAPSCLDPGK